MLTRWESPKMDTENGRIVKLEALWITIKEVCKCKLQILTCNILWSEYARV